MAGPSLLDVSLAVLLGAFFAAGFATRSVALVLLIGLLVRWLSLSESKENGSKQREPTPSRSRSPSAEGLTTSVSGTFVPSTGLLDFSKAFYSGGQTTPGGVLHGTFVPSTGLFDFSEDRVQEVENDNCHCKCYVLYRPTDDPDKEASGEYPNADHFRDRKRLWEFRWQIRVKRPPKRPLAFGIELSQYVPVSGWARRIQTMTVSMLRKAVGKDLYHSCGDNPKDVAGEVERPVFVMPLWAWDQLIISEEGEEPDIRHIESHGVLRTSGRSEFIRQLSRLELQPGKVYTVGFWCISRFLDVVNWSMLGVVPGGVGFDTFCGAPPVHIVIYELDDSHGGKDTRHLQSRKTYWFNLALWSSKVPPSEPTMRKLIPEVSNGPGRAQLQSLDDGSERWCCWR